MMVAGILEINVIDNVLHSNKRIGFFTILLFISLISRLIPTGTFFINDIANYLVWFYLGYFMNCCKKRTAKLAWIGMPFAIGLFCFSVMGKLNDLEAIKMVVGYTGSAIFVVSLYYIMPDSKSVILERISKNSYGIYLFHSPMLYIVFYYFGFLKPFEMVLINFFILFALSYLMTELLRLSKFGRIALGE